MNMIHFIFSTLLFLVDPLIWYKSMSGFGLKSSKKKTVGIVAVSFYYVILWLKELGQNYFHIEHLCTFINILLPLYIAVATFLLFKGKLVKKLMSVGVFYSAMFLSESICIILGIVVLKTPMDVLLSFTAIGVFWTIVSKLMLSTICWIFFGRGKRSWINPLYDKKEIVFILLLNMIYEIPLGTLILKTELHNNPTFISLFCLFQIILIISVSYFWHVLKLQNQTLYKLKCELEVVKQNAGAYKGLRQLKHDIAGHVKILLDLCKKKKYDMLEEYMEGMYGSIRQADVTFDLPDPALSILMGQLKQKTLDNKIRFRFFNSISDYYLPSHELCSLVGNLVNNAIESTCKLPEENRAVTIEFNYDEGGYYIEVGNNAPLGTDVTKFCLTSKTDKENHGLGMGIIHKIAKKHKGNIVASVTKGTDQEQNYDFVSINVAMKFKEIERLQKSHIDEDIKA